MLHPSTPTTKCSLMHDNPIELQIHANVALRPILMIRSTANFTLLNFDDNRTALNFSRQFGPLSAN